MSEFDRCLPKILASEGGYSNLKTDPGGATNKGIIQRVFSEWLTANGKPMRDIRTITDEEVSAIYRERYWDIATLDKLPVGVSYVVFDGNVNSGVSQSVKWLQRALQSRGVYKGAIDGLMGVGTVSACAQVPDNDALIADICNRRLTFLKALKTWKYFGNGWSARVASVRATGQAWATGAETPVVVVSTDGSPKAFISDAKASPVLAIADSSTGAGVLSGGAAGYIASVKDQLSQYAGTVHFIDSALLWLTLASMGLVGGGAAYRWYAARARAKRADALDIPTAPTSAATA